MCELNVFVHYNTGFSFENKNFNRNEIYFNKRELPNYPSDFFFKQ